MTADAAMTKPTTAAKPFRRRVFYIPGYDPFHPRRYRELYRKEGADQEMGDRRLKQNRLLRLLNDHPPALVPNSQLGRGVVLKAQLDWPLFFVGSAIAVIINAIFPAQRVG